MLRSGHRCYGSYYVTVHGQQELLLTTLRPMTLVVLPELILGDSCQDPLVLPAHHFLPESFAKQEQRPLFVKITKNYSNILVLTQLD